jgi:ligand-binding SRPBCC domain-containing protein
VSRIDLSLWVAASPHVVFDLSTSIDVHSASMARSAERAVDGVTEGHIDLGEQVTWRARHFGLTFRMTSRITEMAPPERFVDEQVAGPFKYWRHVHVFEAEGEGTRMFDEIAYEVPLGMLGGFADRVFLNGYLTRLIAERNAFIKEAAEARRRPS